MADSDFSSSNKDINVTAGAKKRSLKPNELVAGMTKDTRKRWVMVLVGTAVSISVLAAVMSGPTKPSTTVVSKTEPGVVDTSPKGLTSQKDWRSQTGADLAEIRAELKTERLAREKTNAQLALVLKKMQENDSPRRGAGSQAPAAGNAPQTEPRVNLTLPPPPAPPSTLTPAPATTTPTQAPMAPPPPPSAATPVATPPKAPVRSPARSFVPATMVADATTTGSTRVDEMVPNERKGFLPAGSFAKATLISGVEAFTGGTAQSQPQPLVIRLDANAVLPNAANYQIKGCHVLASVWGDMSSERVFGRLATLTCVDARNRLVLSEEVEGVIVDSDGKNGVRGSLQDRQGAKLARSLLAGFAEGVSNAFGAAQSTVSTTAFGSTSQILGRDVGRAGAYQGAATAAEELSDFYLKQAESTMPIIAVDAGRRVSVLFTKSKALKFETTDSYRSEPQKKLHVERMVN